MEEFVNTKYVMSIMKNLPSSGDVSVNELFDNYIAFYKIDLCGNYQVYK